MPPKLGGRFSLEDSVAELSAPSRVYYPEAPCVSSPVAGFRACSEPLLMALGLMSLANLCAK